MKLCCLHQQFFKLSFLSFLPTMHIWKMCHWTKPLPGHPGHCLHLSVSAQTRLRQREKVDLPLTKVRTGLCCPVKTDWHLGFIQFSYHPCKKNLLPGLEGAFNFKLTTVVWMGVQVKILCPTGVYPHKQHGAQVLIVLLCLSHNSLWRIDKFSHNWLGRNPRAS